MKIRFIGDVHGKFDKYLDVINGVDVSVQIGDYGVGFCESSYKIDSEDEKYLIERYGPHKKNKGSHRFIRGNHDNPEACRENPNWIPDGTIEDDIMFIGGAYSIDKEWRTPNWDWWEDEELSYNQFEVLISKAIMYRPRIMVTHDCPRVVVPTLFDGRKPIRTITQNAFDVILDQVQPDLWIFGHWHEHRNVLINKTRFVCLAELQSMDVEINGG